MSNFIRATYSIDQETQILLEQLAANESDGEPPNESRTIRKLIREKAAVLGISLSNKDKNSNKTRKTTN